MRVIRVLLVVGLVLAGLFTAADRLAVGYAEDELAAKVRAGGGSSIGSTEVDIAGFPFLTQVMDRRLERVDVRLDDVTVAADGRRMRIARLDAALHDVAVDDDYSGGTARRADGSALVTYEDLTRASQSGVTVAYGGAPGKVKVTASIEILGRTLTRSVISTVTLVDGGTVRVRADEVPGEGIPGVEDLVRRKTDFDRKLGGGLPAGLALSGLTSDASGVRLTLGGSDVALGG
ncbi:DUF2993 domain-containing protein [Streptomyces sp. NPDC012888]|uniref:LmeA family phospholipid-binding protein n=1 Tax=Streptomyces sp. NPDC012888 TaxID=3364855 RepID=UPI0036A7F4FB